MSFDIKQEGEFRYIDKGNGPVVVILHGLFGSLSNFEQLITLLQDKYRFILPILPIYDCEIKHANLDGMLDYFRNFIDHFKIKDFTLLGNSLGGHIALLHELKYPNESKGIVLTGSSGLFENALGKEFPKRDRIVIRSKIEEIFGNKTCVSDKMVDEVMDIVSNYGKILRIIRMAKSATRQNLTYEIEKIKTKALLIWGEEDIITPMFVANQFREKLSNAELVTIPGCGHAAMMEYPEAFSNHLNPFLSKVYNQCN